jgi:hypothetical protein
MAGRLRPRRRSLDPVALDAHQALASLAEALAKAGPRQSVDAVERRKGQRLG